MIALYVSREYMNLFQILRDIYERNLKREPLGFRCYTRVLRSQNPKKTYENVLRKFADEHLKSS